jgi:hypothetical protein
MRERERERERERYHDFTTRDGNRDFTIGLSLTLEKERMCMFDNTSIPTEDEHLK